MDPIEYEARRAFALAINCLESRLRPDADKVEFNYLQGSNYELRMSVDGYSFVGRYDSRQANADLFVDVTITQVTQPDDSKTYPNFEYGASRQDLGDAYAKLYE